LKYCVGQWKNKNGELMDQEVAWFQVKEHCWGLGLEFEAEEPGLSSWSSWEENPVKGNEG